MKLGTADDQQGGIAFGDKAALRLLAKEAIAWGKANGGQADGPWSQIADLA